LSVFDAATTAPVAGSPFATDGTEPVGVALSPDGSRVYVTNSGSNNLSVFDAVTNAPVAGSPFATGGTVPFGVATCPPQAPLATDLVVRFTG
jgi:YVTN family beta-propeller protein